MSQQPANTNNQPINNNQAQNQNQQAQQQQQQQKQQQPAIQQNQPQQQPQQQPNQQSIQSGQQAQNPQPVVRQTTKEHDLKGQQITWVQEYQQLLDQSFLTTQENSGFHCFIRGLLLEQSQKYNDAIQFYNQGYSQFLDSLCALRLSEIYAHKNDFQISPDFSAAWFYIIISCSLMNIQYGLKSQKGEESFLKIKNTADENLDNSKGIIASELQMHNSKLVNIKLMELLLDMQYTKDQQIMQLQYDKILQLIKECLQKDNEQSQMCYNTLIGLFCIDSEYKDKRVDEVLDLLCAYDKFFQNFIQQLQTQLQIWIKISNNNEYFTHFTFLVFEAYHIRKAMIILQRQKQKQNETKSNAQANQQDNSFFQQIDQQINSLLRSFYNDLYKKDKLQDKGDQIFLLRYLSESELRQAMLRESPQKIDKAREIAEEELNQNKNNENNYAYCYYYLAKIMKKQKHDSTKFLQKSQKYYQNLADQNQNDHFMQFMVSYYLGRIEQKLNDNPNQNQKARKFFEKAVKLYCDPIILNSRTFQFELLYRKIKNKLIKMGENPEQIDQEYQNVMNTQRTQNYDKLIEDSKKNNQVQQHLNDQLAKDLIKSQKLKMQNSTLKQAEVKTVDMKKFIHTHPCLEQLPITLQKEIIENPCFKDRYHTSQLKVEYQKNLSTLHHVPIDQITLLGQISNPGQPLNRRTFIASVQNKFNNYAVKQIPFISMETHEKIIAALKQKASIRHNNILPVLGYSVTQAPSSSPSCLNLYLIQDLYPKNLQNQLQIMKIKQREDPQFDQNKTEILKKKLKLALQICLFQENQNKKLIKFFSNLIISNIYICEALSAIQQNQQYHGNLKDTNILIDQEEENAYISDWISELIINKEVSEDTDEAFEQSVYKPLEFLQGNSTKELDDVWAFGIILAQMFFGFDREMINLNKSEWYNSSGVKLQVSFQETTIEGNFLKNLQILVEKMLLHQYRINLNNVKDGLYKLQNKLI